MMKMKTRLRQIQKALKCINNTQLDTKKKIGATQWHMTCTSPLQVKFKRMKV